MSTVETCNVLLVSTGVECSHIYGKKCGVSNREQPLVQLE